MPKKDVKTILLVSSSGGNCSFSILFHCARYWADQGTRVLFISKTPLKYLPLNIGKQDSTINPDSFKLIQFMYLTSCRELLQQLCSIHLRHNPVPVIIVKNLENYFKNESNIDHRGDHASLICASLLYAASITAKIVCQPSILISEYVSEDSTIDKSIITNFFHNVWEVKRRATRVTLSKLSPSFHAENVVYSFNENLSTSTLMFEEIVRKILT